ncbi:plexin-B-like [Saccoglossus kowalevskii]
MPGKVPDVDKTLARAVLLSSKDPTPLGEFRPHYKTLVGRYFQYRQMGFSTLLDCLKSIPDVVRIEHSLHDGILLYGVNNEKTDDLSLTTEHHDKQEDSDYKMRDQLSASKCGLYSICIPSMNHDKLRINFLRRNDTYIMGDVYVGGGNYVYRLDSDLQLIYNITTKPDDGTDNYNKILSINYDYNNLITCGSYRGVCQIRDLSDLSVLNDSVTWVAAPTKEDSTVGFVAPGYDNKPNLYVGTPRRGNAYPGDQAVSGRQLDELLFHSARSWEWECAVDMYWFYENSVIYVTGFSYHRFSYFLTVQRLSRNDNTYISRIVRVCQERNDYYYDSYTEVTLQCEGSDSTLYNLLQAADVMRPASDLATSLSLEDDEHVLFAVFGKGRTPWSLTPLQHSVICIYKMTDIEQAFIDAISGCITQGGDEYQLDHIFESRCYTWDNGGNIPVHFHSYYCNQYDNVILPDPVRVYNDTKFDAYSRYLYVLVEYNVYKLEVQNCKQYTTCRECFEAMDPYCGWCTLERRCSLYNECPFSNIRSRWLSVFSDERCVNITEIEPADSVPKSVHNQITLHVSELPDERNYIPAYECNFGNTSITPANQSGQTLTCETPLTNQRPDIPEGCTNCVSSNWACDWCVYENICTHASDTCMKDSYSSIVVGEHNKFSSRDIRGWSSCPHLEQQDGEVLIHVDEATPIVISAANVPKGNPGFQCVLKGIGFEDYVAATRYNESTVLCHAKQYNYDTNVQEVNVSLTVQWNNNYKIDDIYGYTVTLYDCRIDRKDCSGCLSTITTREELQCGWCVSDSSCQISSHCNRHWWSQDVTENCDDPIISEIYPSSGPYEGDTDIIINGSNLGKMFSLVKSVTVGGRSCTVIQERYRVSRSIECTTQSGDIDYSGEISITVIGNDGKTQTGTSGHVVKFTWRKQRVVGFFPTFGPKAGGTRILISGQYMDAGRNITADIGGSVCSVDREEVNETNIICTSSSHQVTSSASFTVYFDGSARPVTLINYKYLENPVIKNIFPLSSMFR